SAADLFHRNDVSEIAKAGAALLFLDGDAEQPEIAELRPQFAREAVVAVDVRGQRCDTLRGELRHGVAQGVDVFSEAEVEVLHLKCSIGQVGESEQACESCPIVRQS